MKKILFFFLTAASRSSTPRCLPAPQVPSSAVQRYRWRGVSRANHPPVHKYRWTAATFFGCMPVVIAPPLGGRWFVGLNGKENSAPHFAVFTARPPTPPPLPLQSSRRSSLRSPAPILSSHLVLNLLTSTYSSSSLFFFSFSFFLLFYSLSLPLILLLLHQFIHNVCPRPQVQGR